MRLLKTLSFSIICGLFSCQQTITSQQTINQEEETYTEDWESLAKANKSPEWYKDAKFGIYTHWGPVSGAFVNMDKNEYLGGWHGMLMYGKDGLPNWKTGEYPKKKDGTPDHSPTSNYLHHVEQFGDPKDFGYKYLIENFKPTGFDAEKWAELFEKSGAKFAGPVAIHHDNFAMWDSKMTRWNSVNYGGVDISKELKNSVEKRGMKFIASFHHAFTWKYFIPAHEYGGISPEDYDLYTTPHGYDSNMPTKEYHDEWWAKLKEYIDDYQPDIIWFDWWLENMDEKYRQKFLSYYYNKGKEWNKEVVVMFKETTFPEPTAIRDYERGRPNQPKEDAWVTDTSPGTWFYRSNAKFVDTNELVDILIDIVSKNGNMLLNVPPNPDGTIPPEMENLLTDMGQWLEVNGEAIYGTRPWTIFGEGPTRIPAGGHKIERKKIVYKANDIRFTKKNNNEFYAFVMDTPSGDIVIETLSTRFGILNNAIEKIQLVGSDEPLKWERTDLGVVIKRPSSFPTKYAHAFKIQCEGYKETDIGGDLEQAL
ncbi:alpha-L-fucosidase [Flammeovirga agarivorans]|uniref:alpha-L-fucosidase n=1 Tax=Flammeovirga agarivorans TaxID=2726742 RepID=A0A7X8SN84_9BACT|nr:alpha-L-fucosidase [Flammeovirga agarivorans]NLR93336.1 alpha-L-fucosidase [Flammeovirga agarivorans]